MNRKTALWITACLFLVVTTRALAVLPIPPAAAPCAERPEPERWQDAGTPDEGRRPPLYSVHRGGVNLAPQQTLWAYRYALAYQAPLLEVDVRQTLDGRFVDFHDDEVSGRTDGQGRIEEMTFEQVRALNYADYDPWKGSVYDPAQILSLEEVLELARSARVGVELDPKFLAEFSPPPDVEGFAGVVNRYPDVMRRSVISGPRLIYAPLRERLWRPRFEFNLGNRLEDEVPLELYRLSFVASLFGGEAKEFTAEKIAAIHDGCGLALPHSYDEGQENELLVMLRLVQMGADGFQTNQADLARAVLFGPVGTELVPGDAADSVCLVNSRNGYGLPRKTLRLFEGAIDVGSVQTELGGCAGLPSPSAALTILFEGDQSAAPALRQPDVTPALTLQ